MAAITKTLTINGERWFASLNGSLFTADNEHSYYTCFIDKEDQYTNGVFDPQKAFKCGGNKLLECIRHKKEEKKKMIEFNEWDGVIS